jgi:phospholipid-translocating ATPase
MKKEDKSPLKNPSGKKGKGEQSERIVVSQDALANASFPKNHVTNTKYTILTFLPKNIKEQFSRPINMYFLLIACLQLFSELTPVNPLTTWGPLIFAFTLTAVKEGYDDYLRYKSDKIANERQCVVIQKGEKKNIPSNAICVGDIVYLRNDTEIPCDLVLLGSSDDTGTSYIQTANLDGETDLKTRTVLTELLSMHEDGGIKSLESFAGKIGTVSVHISLSHASNTN